MRKSVKVTGSAIYKAVGLDSLKEQRSYFDEIVKGEEMPKHDVQLSAMDYGSRNEIKVKRQAMIRNRYNQIPYPALKTKREITKYIN